MNRPMRILHVETGMHLYGGALQVFYLLRGLRGQVDNVLVCPRGSAIGQAVGDVAHVHELPMRGDLDLPFIFRLRRLIQLERPDLVHLHSRRGADVLGGIAARLTGTPCLLTRRVDNPEPPWLARLKYGLYARVITISEGIRRVLLAEGVPASHVTCVHSAVDKEKFNWTCERDWFLHEFDLPGTARVLGMVAQLIPRKGHRYLLAALPEIVRHHPDVRVLLFGKGPLHDELARQIREADLGDQVRLAGFRTDLERILPCLHAVVHPADMEGLGVSLLQAAAAGVPIVATRAGGIPEIVQDGVNGLLIPAGDSAALTQALQALLSDAALARRLGAAGKRIVAERFSIEAMVVGNLHVYRSLLSGGGVG